MHAQSGTTIINKNIVTNNKAFVVRLSRFIILLFPSSELVLSSFSSFFCDQFGLPGMAAACCSDVVSANVIAKRMGGVVFTSPAEM